MGRRAKFKKKYRRKYTGAKWKTAPVSSRTEEPKKSLASKNGSDVAQIHPIEKAAYPTLTIQWRVLRQIIDTIGRRPAETGGMFGGANSGSIVSEFFFDSTSVCSRYEYSPDFQTLNRLLQEKWGPAYVDFLGFIHSHPGQFDQLSSGDIDYAKRILQYNDHVERLWLPLVTFGPNEGDVNLRPWSVASRESSSVEVEKALVRVADPPASLKSLGEPMDKIRINLSALQEAEKVETEPAFVRVQTAYDLRLMAASRVIVVGCGGAAAWVEDLARVGIGQFVLIDPDVYSPTNISTQQAYRRDEKKKKVKVLAARIKAINASAKVLAISTKIEKLDDAFFEKILFGALDGCEAERVLLAGMTDNFYAQARVNRIGLHYQVPTIAAQLHHEGSQGEITYVVPGVTPACHRCMLKSRYDYFASGDRPNPVGSQGTPIWATGRLNAAKGYIALGLLHHDSGHPRWGGLIRRLGPRNLLQVRMHHELILRESDGNANSPPIFFDDTVCIPQSPVASCPDCGGTGDLRDSRGKFARGGTAPKFERSKP